MFIPTQSIIIANCTFAAKEFNPVTRTQHALMILRNNNNNVPGWDGMGAGKAGQMRIKGRTLGSVLFRLISQRRVNGRIETGIVLAIKAMRQWSRKLSSTTFQLSFQFNSIDPFPVVAVIYISSQIAVQAMGIDFGYWNLATNSTDSHFLASSLILPCDYPFNIGK